MRTAMEELALYNMLLVEALDELLVDKGVLSSEEIKQRVKKLRGVTRLLFPRLQ
jgi:hypothetical protein